MKKFNDNNSSLSKFDPRCLVKAAQRIDRSRKLGRKRLLAMAVSHNRKLWADIHYLSARPNEIFPRKTCVELTRLSDYVCSATKCADANVSDMVLDTLINIDLQISEGLIYGYKQ